MLRLKDYPQFSRSSIPEYPYDYSEHLLRVESSFAIEQEVFHDKHLPQYALDTLTIENITKDTLLKWNTEITGISAYRETRVQIVDTSGKVWYTAPVSEQVPELMEELIQYINTPDKSFEKAVLSHLYFLTIHPFEDGNGRVGRAILDYFSKGLWLSYQIYSDRKNYYTMLNNAKTYEGIVKYVEWFKNILHKEIIRRDKLLVFSGVVSEVSLNDRQLLFVKEVITNGVNVSIRAYIKLCKVYPETARKELSEINENVKFP